MSEVETVEIAEETKSAVAEPNVPSREDLRSKGWSAKELDAAEKRGMVSKPEDKKAEVKKESPVVEEKAEEKKLEAKDFTHSQHLREMELTEDQEKQLRSMFPFVNGKMNPVEAIYWRGKNERKARQQAMAELEKERADRKALEERIRALESPAKRETDEEGNEIDPDDKPLTLKQLKELQKAEAEEADKKSSELRKRAAVVAEAQNDQEEYARSVYNDFDDTVKKAQEVIESRAALVPEKWKQAKARKLIQDLQVAAANADTIGLDEYSAAIIAYEIGQLHPEYSKSNGAHADTNGKLSRPEKANGGLTPEQMKRIEENTQRRASSASIPGGGGKRVVAADDVSLNDLNKMSAAQRLSFRQKHPDQYAKLLRG